MEGLRCGLDLLLDVSAAPVVRGFVNSLALQTQDPRLDVPLGDEQGDGFFRLALILARGLQSRVQVVLALRDAFHVGVN